MAIKITMPKMSDTMEDGVIAAWHKKVGDSLESGELLAEIETDKATMEYEAFDEGTILYLVEEKSTVPVDGLIAIVGESGEDFQDLLKDGGESQTASAGSATPTPNVSESIVSTPVQDVSNIPAVVVQMPKMSDTMEEGVIATWHKQVGDVVSSGDLLAEIETDKATMEYEAFDEGTLLYIAAKEGDSVPVDGLLCVIGEKGANFQALVDNFSQTGTTDTQSSAAPSVETPTTSVDSMSTATTNTTTEGGRVKISPLARKLAEEKGYDIRQIKGSGDNGRIIKRDVEQFTPAVAVAKPTSSATQEKLETTSSQVTTMGGGFAQEAYEDVPVSQMRKTIARRLGESKFSAPHFYLTMEITMDEAISTRKRLNEISPVKISFNDMIVKASSVALKQHPAVNAAWLEDKVRYHQHVHVGVAVAVDEGLLVPVVRFSDVKTLSQIAGEVKELAQKARDKKLQPSEWEGNTFSISNLGMFGIEEFTAIINPPNSCILAVGGIKQVVVPKDGEFVVSNVMKVTLSCDHRVVDGATGAAFLQTLKALLESPVRMLV